MQSASKALRGTLLVALFGLTIASYANALDVGEKAPDFTLMAPGNTPVKLADLLAKGPVVIYTFVDAFGAA